MSKTKNPFEALANIYKEFVDREDEKGLAEVYKEATKLVFKEIKKKLKEGNIISKATDVKYLDDAIIELENRIREIAKEDMKEGKF